MKNKFYNDNNLKNFISWVEFDSLKKIHLLKNRDLYTDHVFFLLEGELEVFSTNIDGESIKLKHLTPKNILFGIFNLFENHSHFLTYTAKENCVLLELPSDLVSRKFNDLKFLKFLIQILGTHFDSFTKTALLINNYPSQIKLKTFFKQEMDHQNIVDLKNPGKFIDKYNLSKTTFYRELKKLEKSGWLTKKGSIIKINSE